jgi:pyruvate dehydrogenase E1 component
VRAAAILLRDDFGISSDVWSVTSFNELARDGMHTRRWNMLHPDEPVREAYVTKCLKNQPGPVIASTDYIKLYGEQIRAYVPTDYTVLGTDGFGRSDTRNKLRHFFEVDRYYVTVAALEGLALRGQVERSLVVEAMRKYNIDRNSPNPATI